MASDKEQMMSSANYYAGRVAAVKHACTRAKDSIAKTQQIVCESWNGAAGDAMITALSDVQSELDGISERLRVLESKMRSDAASIYNSWEEHGADAQ